MNVSEFIANYLYEWGIRDIFMLSGGGAIHLDNAVAKHGGLREVCIKNEATGPMMAKAYAQMTKNFGVVFVTTGPGGANAVTGVVECFVDSSPVLVISGQAPVNQTTHHLKIQGLRTFGVQELNIIDIVTPITKYAKMVTDPNSILFELQKAIHIAKSGRPGPVWLDIPLDVQSATVTLSEMQPYNTAQKSKPPVPQEHVDDYVRLVKHGQRPLIVAGQGVRNGEAIQWLKMLAEQIDAPIIFSRMGLDTLPFSYKHNMGIGGFKGSRYNKQIMREADTVLAVGTSMSVAFAGYDLAFFNKDAPVFMVDIEDAEAFKFARRLKHFSRCEAEDWLKKAVWSFNASGVNRLSTPWMERCSELKEKYNASVLSPARNPIDIYYLVKKIDEASTENDVFVDDAGSIYYVASQTLTFNKGQREVTSGAFASMGNAVPLAIGAAIANRDMRILAMTGDGSLETNIQELKTLSYYNLNVKLFVINNGGYISMRDHGRVAVGEQSESVVTFEKIADAYGLPYHCISDYKELDNLDNLLNTTGPLFIEVMCDDKQKLVLPT